SLPTQETEYSVSCVEKISPLSIQIHFRETLPHLHYTKFLTVPSITSILGKNRRMERKAKTKKAI
ncbi:hypothetical protein ETB99_14675, partial [Anoxybacillus sp. CHMUD]|nr:hypothetical protein [Anoxybacillus sp. CHMUD]